MGKESLVLLTLIKQRRKPNMQSTGRVRTDAKTMRKGATSHTPTDETGLAVDASSLNEKE